MNKKTKDTGRMGTIQLLKIQLHRKPVRRRRLWRNFPERTPNGPNDTHGADPEGARGNSLTRANRQQAGKQYTKLRKGEVPASVWSSRSSHAASLPFRLRSASQRSVSVGQDVGNTTRLEFQALSLHQSLHYRSAANGVLPTVTGRHSVFDY